MERKEYQIRPKQSLRFTDSFHYQRSHRSHIKGWSSWLCSKAGKRKIEKQAMKLEQWI